MKIYTRTGDDGTTSLFSGDRVAKDDLRVETYGTVDELNAVLGVARAAGPHTEVADRIRHTQNQLFTLGADFATPGSKFVPRIGQSDIDWLEREIDRISPKLPALRNFILAGGSPAAAQIHLARTVCRRAERLAVRLADGKPLPAAIYLNRLSDFLFTLARYENLLSGFGDDEWVHEDRKDAAS